MVGRLTSLVFAGTTLFGGGCISYRYPTQCYVNQFNDERDGIREEATGNIIYDSAWDEKPFTRLVRDFYNKFVIPSRIDNTTDRLIGDVKSFKEQVKSFLELLGKQ